MASRKVQNGLLFGFERQLNAVNEQLHEAVRSAAVKQIQKACRSGSAGGMNFLSRLEEEAAREEEVAEPSSQHEPPPVENTTDSNLCFDHIRRQIQLYVTPPTTSGAPTMNALDVTPPQLEEQQPRSDPHKPRRIDV